MTDLRDRGRETAERWLAENFKHIGKRSSVDIRKNFLQPSPVLKRTHRRKK